MNTLLNGTEQTTTPDGYTQLTHRYQAEEGTWALACLGFLVLLLMTVIWNTKMWREKDQYWNYISADVQHSDITEHCDTQPRSLVPAKKVTIRQLMESKLQTLKIFVMRHHNKGYTQVSSECTV